MKYRKITSALCIGMLSLAFISPLLWAGEPGKFDTSERLEVQKME